MVLMGATAARRGHYVSATWALFQCEALRERYDLRGKGTEAKCEGLKLAFVRKALVGSGPVLRVQSLPAINK